jgi:predicted nuclease of predicted toxin-antitoxin system
VRVKLDENLPRAARAVLEARGWDVHDVHQERLSGVLDSVLREACERERRVLITLDTDFSDVRLVSPATSPGIVLLRPPNQSVRSTVGCLEGAARLLDTESPQGALWIVEPDRVRVCRRNGAS